MLRSEVGAVQTGKRAETLGFKECLYEHYTTQHVQTSNESVRGQLNKSRPYLRRLVTECVPMERSASILDLGCGFGSLLCVLRDAGYTNLAGVDVSPEQVALARHLNLDHIHCETAQGFLEHNADQTRDVVIAFDFLEHLSRSELLPMVSDIRRVLRPGGRLILHVPNGEGLFFGSILFGDLTHEMAFTRSSLNQLAGACGLRLVRTLEDTPPVHGMKSLMRRVIWQVGTYPLRILSMAETGDGLRGRPFSRNILAILERV